MLNRFRRFFRNRRTPTQIDKELRFHIDQQIKDHIAAGLTPQEAARRTKLEFGTLDLVKEEIRDTRWETYLGDCVRDVRYGVRTLRKSPGFTAIAVLTLALGIGANTAIFSAVNGILIEPLPYTDSARLIEIESLHRPTGDSGETFEGISLPAVRDIESQCPAFSELSAYGFYGSARMLGGLFPDFVSTVNVDGNFFRMLGIRPLLGRFILPSDTKPGNGQVAVLDYDFWNSDFGGDPRVIGRTVVLGETPAAIVGVMPPEFHLGLSHPGIWLPLISPGFEARRGVYMFSAMARLRPGAKLEAANAQLNTLAVRLGEAYPKTDHGWDLRAKTAKDVLVGPVRAELLLLLAAVFVVLMIGCLNVSGMLLTRMWARRREVAIREMLGAPRLRILRQFLIESLLLSFIGGSVGILIAFWAIPAVRAIAPSGTPRITRFRLDLNVLLFTAAVSVMSGIFFGLTPVLRARGNRIGASLKRGLGELLGGFSTRGTRRLGSALVIVEISLAVTLATGAALVARSLQRLVSVQLGFRTDHVLTVSAEISNGGCDFQHPRVCQLLDADISERLRGLGGVESVAVSAGVPLLGGYGTRGFKTGGQTASLEWNDGLALNMVSPEYFRVMGIPFLAGREFTGHDREGMQRVAIVSRSFTERYLRGGSPVGQEVSIDKDKSGHELWMDIVGEVSDVREDSPAERPYPAVYMSWPQTDQSSFPNFNVRTSINPSAIADAVKNQIWAVDKDAPILRLSTMDQIVSNAIAEPRFQTVLFSSFAALGLILAMVGVYGVISYSVTLRAREIGVRMALGATPLHAFRMILREGMLLAGVGVIIGNAGALALTRFLRSFLFEVAPTDPATFAVVNVAISVAVLAACWIPAQRAMRADPIIALRHE